MIEINNSKVDGWEAVIRGMRNPMNSWDKSDSYFTLEGKAKTKRWEIVPHIGENDLKLMMKLSKAGTDHGKFMRMINVSMDINAPLYWWKEFDTYKVGTVANSCSTMHKIHEKEFTLDDFSHDNLSPGGNISLLNVIERLNISRNFYLKTEEKEYWWDMIQLLPSSYNQRRTISTNYAVLKNMYHARKNHKLTEWRVFCAWIELLPYSELITNC
jgi:hypothetical protein